VIGNDGHDITAIAENLSSVGVLLYVDQFIREGSEIGGKRMWCFGTVLRVEKELKQGKFEWLSDFSVSKYSPRLRAAEIQSHTLGSKPLGNRGGTADDGDVQFCAPAREPLR
jgi:hypothetical protein